jgi:hypothetical protein
MSEGDIVLQTDRLIPSRSALHFTSFINNKLELHITIHTVKIHILFLSLSCITCISTVIHCYREACKLLNCLQ